MKNQIEYFRIGKWHRNKSATSYLGANMAKKPREERGTSEASIRVAIYRTNIIYILRDEWKRNFRYRKKSLNLAEIYLKTLIRLSKDTSAYTESLEITNEEVI